MDVDSNLPDTSDDSISDLWAYSDLLPPSCELCQAVFSGSMQEVFSWLKLING